MDNELIRQLGIEVPIVQAPMAGGPTTPELVAGVCNQGGLGSIGAGYLSPEDLRSAIYQTRALTDKPFNVNLFAPSECFVDALSMRRASDAINACSQELNFETRPVSEPYGVSFDDQLSVLLEEKVPVVSFIFGIPDASVIIALKEKGSFVIGTATTLEEGLFLQENQVDAIVAQGNEAGGHRGSFLKREEDSLVARDALLDKFLAEVKLPIIAAGGIMNGKDIHPLLSRGVSAVQMGTAFLFCEEAGIPSCYREILIAQQADNTVLTRAFSGRLARGIGNAFTRCMANKEDSLSDYPAQNKLTSAMRKQAKAEGNADYLSLWAGQEVCRGRVLPVKELMSLLKKELGL